jgi:hypothetical protein
MVYYLELILYHTQLTSQNKTLLNPSANGRGLYHRTTWRSGCCTIAQGPQISNRLIHVTKYTCINHLSYSWTYLNKLLCIRLSK